MRVGFAERNLSWAGEFYARKVVEGKETGTWLCFESTFIMRSDFRSLWSFSTCCTLNLPSLTSWPSNSCVEWKKKKNPTEEEHFKFCILWPFTASRPTKNKKSVLQPHASRSSLPCKIVSPYLGLVAEGERRRLLQSRGCWAAIFQSYLLQGSGHNHIHAVKYQLLSIWGSNKRSRRSPSSKWVQFLFPRGKTTQWRVRRVNDTCE